MPLHADNLALHDLSYLNDMVINYESAIRTARNDEAAARSRAEGYERDLVEIRKAVRIRLAGPNPNGPMTDAQRAALFASFADVFGHSDRAPRLAFTGMVLDKAPARLSWSRHKDGALTYGEASKVLDALDVLNV